MKYFISRSHLLLNKVTFEKAVIEFIVTKTHDQYFDQEKYFLSQDLLNITLARAPRQLPRRRFFQALVGVEALQQILLIYGA